MELADNLNIFYLRFDTNDFKEQVDQMRLKTSTIPQLELYVRGVSSGA